MKIDATIAKFLSTPWAINRIHFDNGLERIRSIDFTAHNLIGLRNKMKAMDSRLNMQIDRPFGVIDGVAIIPITGMILKEVPYWFELYGIAATSTEELRESIELATIDPEVNAILLEIDSPGGTVDGVQELSDAIFRARSEKRIHAAVRDLCASAALWLGSQAHFLSANVTAAVGSIGCVFAVDDLSKMYAEHGVRTILIASGEFKGAGTEGTEITEDQIAPWQEIVDQICDEFVIAVARGRGVQASVIEPLATGRTWQAPAAKTLGLIDEVENFDAALSRLVHAA